MKLRKTLSLLSIAFLGFITSQFIASAYSDYEIPEFLLPTQKLSRPVFVESEQLLQVTNAQDALCLRCHKDLRELSTVKGHEEIHCTDCHVSLKEHRRYRFHERPQPSAIPACLDCHNDYDKNHNQLHSEFDPNLTKNPKQRKNDEPLPTCSDCHNYHRTNLSNSFASVISDKKVNKCIDCHLDEYKDFTASNHFNAILKNSPNAPDCLTCHNVHKPKDIDKVSMCLSCHLDSQKFPEVEKRHFVVGYFTEFHGRIALSNLNCENQHNTLVCSDCHNAHAASTMHAKNFTSCGNNDCHSEVPLDFINSVNIHGRNNVKITSNFAAWLVQLLGKIVLGILLVITLIDNLFSTLKLRTKNSNNSKIYNADNSEIT